MRIINILMIVALMSFFGCSKNKKSDVFITIDVGLSYPVKELLLQKFMDIEYVALETTDEFLCQGHVLDVGENTILVRNNIQDGNIYVFEKNGKSKTKINRKGEGNEEYLIIYGAILDENIGEIFVNDIAGRKIIVYDLYGKFKRKFPYSEGLRYNNIHDFDKENFICDIKVDNQFSDKYLFAIISKKDGCITNKIQIPYKQKKSTVLLDDNGMLNSTYLYCPILPFNGCWILTEASSDTVYVFSPDHNITPFMVRIPSIQSMNPEIFLFPRILTDQYYFLDIVEKGRSFSKTDLVYDKKTKKLYEYTLYNADYSNKQRVNLITWGTKNDKISFWQKIEANDLFDARKKGLLKGELKKISEKLDEESNPVIMLVTNK